MEENSQPGATGAQGPAKVTLEEKNVGSSYKISEFRVDGWPGRDERQVDVLLIHGLTGDPIKTWGGSLDRDKAVSDCWPRKLAIENRSNATFWTLGYPAPLFDKELNKIQSNIYEEGREALEELVHAGLGDKPIIFVTHSLGGLLAKAILAQSDKCKNLSAERQILESTHAVIFVGTPHAGSPQTQWRFLVPFVVQLATKGVSALVVALAAVVIATPVLSVSLFGFTWQATLGGLVALVVSILGVWGASRLAPGRHVLMLDPKNPGLRGLTEDFRRIQSEHMFLTDSFYEQEALWSLFLVVPWWSADPGVTDCKPDGIRADHISMCKNPYAELLQRRVKERIKTACYGKTVSVFGEKLRRLSKNDHEPAHAFRVLFDGERGDRGSANETFRTFLREKMRRAEFVPSSRELDLALRSNADEDELVWKLWSEQKFADDLRRLRRKAEKEVKNDFRLVGGSAAADITLIPFYRSLRTIEHICTGDLPDPGSSNKLDCDLLLELIREAEKKLDEMCLKEIDAVKDGKEWQVDGDGSTRRLLLRMSSIFQAVRAAQVYDDTGKMEQRGEELAALLNQRREDFDDALARLRNRFENPPVGSSTARPSRSTSAAQGTAGHW